MNTRETELIDAVASEVAAAVDAFRACTPIPPASVIVQAVRASFA